MSAFRFGRPIAILVAIVTLFSGTFRPEYWDVFSLGAGVAEAQGDPRFFPQTGFRIDNDRFFDYFQKRGGIPTFGYPVSRTTQFLGSTVQFFQRRVIEINPDGSVGQLNLLDTQLLPFNSFNFSVVPATDPAIVAAAPAVGSPGYATAVINFVRARAPETFNGLPVRFFTTFANTVPASAAFPTGGGSTGLLQGFDLEMWGVPISAPAPDPHNGNFIYLRFQRGIMQFNNANQTTQGLLLGDYLKSILTGMNLPADLAAEAATSPFLRQYNNGKPNGLNNPAALPNTNLTNAFEPQASATTSPVGTTGLRFGFNVSLPGQNQPFVLNAVKNAGFGWFRQQIRWADFEPSPGAIRFDILDPIVANAQASGLDVMFSVTTSPTWARPAGPGGPPNNFNDLGNFLAALASRYDGKVRAYEIWNEENLFREWGTINAGQYVELLRVAHDRIKAVDPNIFVLSGGLTPTGLNDPNVGVDDTIYLTELYQYQNGVFKTLADGVGAHMAGYNNPPQDFVGQNSLLAPCHTATGQLTGTTNCFKNNGQFYFRRIDQLHGVMSQVGDSRQMWITEYEWGAATPPVPPGFEWTLDLTEDQVGNFFVQSIQMIQQSRPWVGAVFIWNLNFRMFEDPHTSDSAIFGVLNSDGSPRSIYTKLAQLRK